jgi:hypothetical protein
VCVDISVDYKEEERSHGTKATLNGLSEREGEGGGGVRLMFNF